MKKKKESSYAVWKMLIIAVTVTALMLVILQFSQGKKVVLEAANPKYKPLVPRESLTLGGVVVSVIRKYY